MPAGRPSQPLGSTHWLWAGWVEQSTASPRPLFWGGLPARLKLPEKSPSVLRPWVVLEGGAPLGVIALDVGCPVRVEETEADRHRSDRRAAARPVGRPVVAGPEPAAGQVRAPVAQKTGSKRRT